MHYFFYALLILLNSITLYSKLVNEFCDTDGCFYCPLWQTYGTSPPLDSCDMTDPLNRAKSPIEDWFTKDMFNDLFPKMNLGLGPNTCLPYSYEAFIIAARYFPKFASESNSEENKRDLAAFAAHMVQETGENDLSIYSVDTLSANRKDACFFRGAGYNWFEGGPVSAYLNNTFSPADGRITCSSTNPSRYCDSSSEFFYPCGNGCYFGRGPIQLSYNFNYGAFNEYLKSVQLKNIDVLANPNLILESKNPPLSFLGSLWFYMTAQPPKPSMHNIMIGKWKPGITDEKNGFKGAIFGPTSLVINNECNGEDDDPSAPGESRRIKAFKWFSSYFQVYAGPESTLSCKGMIDRFYNVRYKSYDPDWGTLWKSGGSCKCKPVEYEGPILYFDREFFPDDYCKNWTQEKKCVIAIYNGYHNLQVDTSPCLLTPPDTDLTSCN